MTRLIFICFFLSSSIFSFSQEYFPHLFISEVGTSVRGIEADSLGNFYAIGRGTIQPYCIDSTALEYRGSAYVAKFDRLGNVIWRLNLGGSQAGATGMSIELEGNILVVGSFRGSGDFSSTPMPSSPASASNSDIFLMKISPFGEVIWAQTAGGTSDDEALGIDTDKDGNIYVTGTFNLWADFGPIELEAESGHDPFIWALSPDGFTKWAKSIPSGVLGEGKDVLVDREGNLLNVGEINASGDRLLYIAKYSPKGDQIFMKSINFGYQSNNLGLAVDAQNNIYLTGNFRGSIDFDPGPDEYILSHTGSQLSSDAYLLKLNQHAEFEQVYVIEDSFGAVSGARIAFDKEGNIYHSGTFGDKVDFDPGPAVFEMTTHPQGNNTFVQKLDSAMNFQYALKIGGNSSQAYNHNAFDLGDDGRLYIGRENPGGFVQGFITIYGDCESETIFETIEACDSYELSGVLIDENCLFRTSIKDSSGCEFITQTEIDIIRKLDIPVLRTDTALITNFFSNQMQWLDCEADFAAIPNTNDPLFKPEKTGTYAAEIIRGNCRDTSDCVFFELGSNGTSEVRNPFSSTKIFPSPFSEKINIENLPLAFAKISVYELSGKLIFETEKPDGINSFSIITQQFHKGFYTMIIKNEEGIFRRNVLKN